MAEYSANAVQTVNPGESIIFTEVNEPCAFGLIRHRNDSGSFLLSGRNCACNRNGSTRYLVDFGANIAVPTGEAVGPISVAIAIDGATLASSTMIVTPAAVEDYFNVSRAAKVPIWNGCCETVTIRNTSDIPILVQNANIVFSR